MAEIPRNPLQFLFAAPRRGAKRVGSFYKFLSILDSQRGSRGSAPSARQDSPPPKKTKIRLHFFGLFSDFLGVLVSTPQKSPPMPFFNDFEGRFWHRFLTFVLQVRSSIFCRRPIQNRYFYSPGRPQKGTKNVSKKRPPPERFRRPPGARKNL